MTHVPARAATSHHRAAAGARRTAGHRDRYQQAARVTTETVRRDLDVLERRGLIRRIRGGAELMHVYPVRTGAGGSACRAVRRQAGDRATGRRRAPERRRGGARLRVADLRLRPGHAPRPGRWSVVTNNLPAAQYLAAIRQPARHHLARTHVRGSLGRRRLLGPAGGSHTLTADLAIIGVNGLTTATG